jgi:hypothetical protein
MRLKPRPVLDITDGIGSNSVEDRTAADVMRRMGCDEEEIQWAFGYIPASFQNGCTTHEN